MGRSDPQHPSAPLHPLPWGRSPEDPSVLCFLALQDYLLDPLGPSLPPHLADPVAQVHPVLLSAPPDRTLPSGHGRLWVPSDPEDRRADPLVP